MLMGCAPEVRQSKYGAYMAAARLNVSEKTSGSRGNTAM